MTVTCEIHTDEHGLGEHSAPVSYGVTLVGKAPAGYDAGIIFNYQGPDAMQQFRPGAKGTIPLLFVYRLTGLKLPGVPEVTDATTGDGGAGYVRNGDHGCVRRLGLPSIVQDGDRRKAPGRPLSSTLMRCRSRRIRSSRAASATSLRPTWPWTDRRLV